MSDKEKIQNMTQEEAEEKLIQLLSTEEKAQYFTAGVSAAIKNLGIRPEEFQNGCTENA